MSGPCDTTVVVSPTSCSVVQVCTQGPQGLQGPQGNPGPQGPAGTGGSFQNAISATMSAGSQDYGASPPAGFVTGVTNQLDLTPNASGSSLSGVKAPSTNGFPTIIYNASATVPIILTHHNAGLAANQFTLPNGLSFAIAPNSNRLITYITGVGWTVSAG